MCVSEFRGNGLPVERAVEFGMPLMKVFYGHRTVEPADETGLRQAVDGILKGRYMQARCLQTVIPAPNQWRAEGKVGLKAGCFDVAGDFGITDVADTGVKFGLIEFERSAPLGIPVVGGSGKCPVDGFNFNAVVPECQRRDLGGQVEVVEGGVGTQAEVGRIRSAGVKTDSGVAGGGNGNAVPV